MRLANGQLLKVWSLHFASFLLVAGAYLIGMFDFVERELLDLRFRYLQHDASATLVLVQIDGASIDRMGAWPWPRRVHAQLLERLVAARAERVAFDIDFSSPSDETNDAALEAAPAAAAGRVVLPIFQQLTRGIDGEIGVRVTLPQARFRQHVSLASINVRPDGDGRIRWLPHMQAIDGEIYPSLATALSSAPAHAGSFLVDYGIRPQSVPRISFADVLEGNFSADLFRGKQVLIGATAIELGDQLAVPLWRTIPGPVLNAIAYESLYQGRALHEAGPLWVLALAALVAFGVGPLFRRLDWRGGCVVWLGGAAVLMLGSFAYHGFHQTTVDVTPAGTALLLSFGVGLASRLDQQSLRLLLESVSNMHRRALLDRVVEGSSDGLLIFGSAGEIVLANAAAQEIFGVPSFEDVRVDALFDCQDGQTANALASVLTADPATADGFVGEVVGRSADGEGLPLELTITHVDSRAQQRGVSAEQHLVCVVRDIRERKRIEQLKQQAMEDARRAEQAKADFLATMSHELRTPLNHVIGFSEMLETGMFGELSEKQAEYVGNIAMSGRDLLHLISEILEYSAVRDKDYELAEEQVSPKVLMQDCVNKMRERAQLADVDLRDASGDAALPDIRVDQAKIEQALMNLLSNSIKFSQEGGKVILDVECDLDNGLVFTVEDSGAGMSESQIENALKPFSRGEDAFRRTRDGYGLGLPLAKAIVDLHDGQVSIESEVDKGTKVRVRLPAARIVRSDPTSLQ